MSYLQYLWYHTSEKVSALRTPYFSHWVYCHTLYRLQRDTYHDDDVKVPEIISPLLGWKISLYALNLYPVRRACVRSTAIIFARQRASPRPERLERRKLAKSLRDAAQPHLYSNLTLLGLEICTFSARATLQLYNIYTLLPPRQAILSSTTTEGTTSPVRASGPDTPRQNANMETPTFMPKLLLILSSPPSSSSDDGTGAACEGGNEELLLSVMEALDASEAVPPAIVCCPPPSTSRGSGHRCAEQRCV